MGDRGRRISEFEASLAYKVNYRIARATQRNPVSKNKKIKKKPNQTKLKQNKQKKEKRKKSKREREREREREKTPTDWGKIFINSNSYRGLMPNIYKELKKLYSRKSNNPIKRCGIEINKKFPTEEY